MADNAELNAGSGGITLALDDIGGIHHQRVKVQHGADGSATDVSTASPLPVDLRAQNVDIVVVGTDAENAAASGAPVQVAGRYDATPRTLGDGDVGAIALDADGAIHVSTGGNSFTVDLGATDNAVLDTIASNTTGLSGAVSGSELQVDIVAALPTGTNTIGKLGANSGVDIGDVDILSIAAGSNTIGDVGLATRTSGGVSVYYDNDLDETAVAVKASAGQIYFIHAINLHTAPLYLQLFNVAQGSVTVGTTTPTMQFVIPSAGTANGAGFTIAIPQGIAFGTAITAAASTNSEGNGAPGANLCHVNIGYA